MPCVAHDCLLATLEDISDGPDHAKALEAKGFYHQVRAFSFIISLVVFDKVLSCTKALSDQLRSPQVHLSNAADLVLAIKSSPEDYHNNEMWGKVYNYSLRIADLHGIEVMSPTPTRHRRPPKHLDDCVPLESTRSRECLLCSEGYKRSLYFCVGCLPC